MPRQPIGDRPMTDAERQARYRAARAAGAPIVRTRRPADHRSRARRWKGCRRRTATPASAIRSMAGGFAGQPSRQRYRRGATGDLRSRHDRGHRNATRLRKGLTPARGHGVDSACLHRWVNFERRSGVDIQCRLTAPRQPWARGSVMISGCGSGRSTTPAGAGSDGQRSRLPSPRSAVCRNRHSSADRGQ